MVDTVEPGRVLPNRRMRIRESRVDRVFLTVVVIFLTFVLISVLYPLIFIVSSSFSSTSAVCLLYTSPSPRDGLLSRMPSSA